MHAYVDAVGRTATPPSRLSTARLLQAQEGRKKSRQQGPSNRPASVSGPCDTPHDLRNSRRSARTKGPPAIIVASSHSAPAGSWGAQAAHGAMGVAANGVAKPAKDARNPPPTDVKEEAPKHNPHDDEMDFAMDHAKERAERQARRDVLKEIRKGIEALPLNHWWEIPGRCAGGCAVGDPPRRAGGQCSRWQPLPAMNMMPSMYMMAQRAIRPLVVCALRQLRPPQPPPPPHLPALLPLLHTQTKYCVCHPALRPAYPARGPQSRPRRGALPVQGVRVGAAAAAAAGHQARRAAASRHHPRVPRLDSAGLRTRGPGRAGEGALCWGKTHGSAYFTL